MKKLLISLALVLFIVSPVLAGKRYVLVDPPITYKTFKHLLFIQYGDGHFTYIYANEYYVTEQKYFIEHEGEMLDYYAYMLTVNGDFVQFTPNYPGAEEEYTIKNAKNAKSYWHLYDKDANRELFGRYKGALFLRAKAPKSRHPLVLDIVKEDKKASVKFTYSR